jgi:site-specific DNA-methyltransferase (adenine-specific)
VKLVARDLSATLAPRLRFGRWEDVLGDGEVDAVITDGPYGLRVHRGHNAAVSELRLAGEEKRMRIDKRDGTTYSVGANRRRTITYSHWSDSEVAAFIEAWAPRNRGWFVCMSDHSLCGAYEAAYRRHGLTTFAPVGVLIPGMTVRLSGDGPSSWMLYVNVARPKKLSRWGTLPGGCTGGRGERGQIVGGKPLWLMRALVRDYTRPGDLICDPMAGTATTLIAAHLEQRRAFGAEIDQKTFEAGVARLRTHLAAARSSK